MYDLITRGTDRDDDVMEEDKVLMDGLAMISR